IFTHLFSAPLVEQRMAPGGSGCVLVEKVDKLSYEGERDTLHRTLDNADKRVRFLSEAANTRSFARAVGCRCRILHFTGHGVPGELTFEDDSGQLQYVGEAELLSMLLRGRKELWGGEGAPRTGLQLVFLSSCHSQSVAKCFIEAVR
ncbi:unnamed protein product, partial [Ectocarpus sp. 13 AM-2016]